MELNASLVFLPSNFEKKDSKEKKMLKKTVIMFLMVLVMNLSVVSVFAETKEEKEIKLAEKVKIAVSKLGVGKEVKVQVKLKDGTKVKGYVEQINENSFLVVDENTSAKTEVTYSQAKQIKGNNLSTGVKIAIGVAIVAAIFIVIGLAQ